MGPDARRGARLGSRSPIGLRAHARARDPVRPSPAGRRCRTRISRWPSSTRWSSARRARGPRAVRGLELRQAGPALPPQPGLLAPRGLSSASGPAPTGPSARSATGRSARSPAGGPRCCAGSWGIEGWERLSRAAGRDRAPRPRAASGGGCAARSGSSATSPSVASRRPRASTRYAGRGPDGRPRWTRSPSRNAASWCRTRSSLTSSEAQADPGTLTTPRPA